MSQSTIDEEIAALEAAQTRLHTEGKALKAKRRLVAEQLEILHTQQRMTKDLGLSERGIQTMRQVIGATGIPSATAIGKASAK